MGSLAAHQNERRAMTDKLTAVAGAKSLNGSYALPEEVRISHLTRTGWHVDQTAAGGVTTSIPNGCSCHPRGWNASTDLAVWLEAAANGLNVVVRVQNDGPGWRADIFENRLGGLLIATGWSDGFPEGEFSAEDPPKWKPTPLEALVSAVGQVLMARGAKLAD